jgi:hypothetical protein
LSKVLLYAVLIALVLPACGGNDEAREITGTRKVSRTERLSADLDTRERFGLGARTRTPPPAPTLGYAWDLPAGWKQLPASQFRQGNFLVAGDRNVECYVSVLPGSAGGIMANLDRWRSQMGLGAFTQEELHGLGTLEVLGRAAVRVELDGAYTRRGESRARDGYRLLGVILEHGGRTVTVKMVGPADVVDAERERFLALCRSLRTEGGPPDGHAGGSEGLSWRAPDGWRQAPAKSMRLVTFWPGAEESAECYIAVLGGRAGGLHANINRWLAQVGKPALTPQEIDALPSVDVLGRPCRIVEAKGTYTGMGGPERKDYMLMGVVCELPRKSLFVKMTGPEDVVRRERANFIRFCESIH